MLLSSFTYNLDNNNIKTDGRVDICDDGISAYENGSLKESVPLGSITKCSYMIYAGSTAIELETKEAIHILCRATLESKADFAVIVNNIRVLLQGDEFNRDYKKEAGTVCPKCGAPLRSKNEICVHCIDKKNLLGRLLKIAAPQKGFLIVSLMLFFVTLGINMTGPYINKILVDSYICSEEDIAFTGFILMILLMLGVYLVNYIIQITRNLTVMEAATRLSVNLRDMVFNKIQHMSMKRISERTAGELMQRVTSDTAEIQNFIISYLPNVGGQLLLLIGCSIVMFLYDYRLAVIMIFPLPLALLAMSTFHKKIRKYYGKQWYMSSRSASVLHDIFSGIRVVKAYGSESYEFKRYDHVIAEERNISVKNEVWYATVSPVIRFLMTVGSFFLLYFTGSMILQNDMSLGQATMFSSYVSIIYGPMFWFANLPSALARVFTSLVRLFDILDVRDDIYDSESHKSINIKGHITFENVSFGYEKSVDVLKNINLDIQPGETIGIVGRSGVGKSTLINLIMRLYDVSSGSIKIDGANIRDISQDCLRGSIGVVLQETFLFSGTIYDNILYAKPDATKEEILEVCKTAGVHEFVIKLPDGYNTKIGEKGQTLSGGERQRVAIARALLRDPVILILDEATSALDTEIEKQIQDTLLDMAKTRTTIAIAHRLSTLRNSDRIIVLDENTVAECGTHMELLKKKGIYYDLVMAQRQMSKFQNS